MQHHQAPKVDPAGKPKQFRALSNAYLDAAERLANDLADGVWPASYERGQVAMWLAFHATELFLKACIRQADPSRVINSHSLGELRAEFESCFPSVLFEPPFGPEPMPADWMVIEMALKSDKSHHEMLRYPVDRGDNPWPQNRSFMPDLFVGELVKLRQDIERVTKGVFN